MDARDERPVPRRVTAAVDGDLVVFLIGMRINRPWKLGVWLPVARAMGRMIAELESRPAEETGYLGRQGTGPSLTLIQYWRSFAHLEAWARAGDAAHWPAWTEFNRRMKTRRGDVGIWHETFAVPRDGIESLYSGMPPRGLGRIFPLVPAEGGLSGARGRMDAGGATPPPAPAPAARSDLRS